MTPQDLQHLDEEMKRPYVPHLKNVFDQIKSTEDLAQAARASYAKAQLSNT